MSSSPQENSPQNSTQPATSQSNPSDSKDAGWIWIDGKIVAPEEAKVSVLDRGFLYGDSIYESVRTYDGKFHAIEDHLDRLQGSAAAIELSLPWSRKEIRSILEESASARPDNCEAGLRLTITRGIGPLGLDTSPCQTPRLVVIGWPVQPGRHPLSQIGVDLALTGIQRNSPDALSPHIKSGNFLNNILAYADARKQGAFEGIMLTAQGKIAEASTSNVFWITNGEIHTPADKGILLGVTRKTVLKILKEKGLPFKLGEFPLSELENADEAFLTSTLKGVMPAVRFQGKQIGDGRPGPITKKLQDLFDAETL